MRIDPPVSEPSAAHAAPVATETAPPEVDPPGNARRRVIRAARRIDRRAVVRIDADPRERELALVGVADQRRAGAAQPLHRACSRRCAGGASASRREPEVVRCPWTSNSALTLTARPPSGGSGPPAAPQRIDRRGLGAGAGIEQRRGRRVRMPGCGPRRAPLRAGSLASVRRRRSRRRASIRSAKGEGTGNMLDSTGLSETGAQRFLLGSTKSQTRLLKGVAAGGARAPVDPRFRPDFRTNLWSLHVCHDA